MTAFGQVSVIPVAGELDALGDPSARIILSCERAKTWLLEALKEDQIEQIVELKSQAEAIRVYTVQKQLGHDAELSAAEIVRRAERCIGLAIQKGQKEGRIHSRGSTLNRARDLDHVETVRKVTDFATAGELYGSGERPGIAALTDGVTDSQFEEAIRTAKDERNLSRANVVRKVKGADRELVKPIMRRQPQAPPEEQIERALDSLEFNAKHIARLIADVREFRDWPKRLRVVRTALTRVIGQMEDD